jgi:hypothetical protein
MAGAKPMQIALCYDPRTSGGKDTMLDNLFRHLDEDRGHAGPLPAALLGGIAAIVLGIAVAADIGWLAIVSGIILGGSILALPVMNHILVEYEIYGRIEELEKK